jgi:hypothetical protein
VRRSRRLMIQMTTTALAYWSHLMSPMFPECSLVAMLILAIVEQRLLGDVAHDVVSRRLRFIQDAM